MEINDYIIVDAYCLLNITKNVNEHITKGYIPIGGICVTKGTQTCYYQAMIKYKK